MIRVLFPLVLAVFFALAAAARAEDFKRFTLANGAAIILVPVKESSQVGLIACYSAGILDEPAGFPQASHLLEHLVCRAASGGRRANEAFDLLGARGMVNAETLPTFTHYDTLVPAGDLELALRVEAERLTGLRIDRAIVDQEAPRASSEVDAVENAPQAPLFKFALMAAHQAWRHGRAEAWIKGALVAPALQPLETLRARVQRPENLTLVVAGGFALAEGEALVRKHIGGVDAPRAAEPRRPIAWDAAPKDATVRWDASRAAVIVAFPPPVNAGPAELAALSFWSEAVLVRLTQDAEITGACLSVLGSHSLWPVGEFPLFACAVLRRPEDEPRVGGLLKAKFLAYAAQPLDAPSSMMLARAPSTFAAAPSEIMQAMMAQASRLPGGDTPANQRMALGNGALQIGMRSILVGADPRGWSNATDKAIAELPALLSKTVSEDRAIVTTLVPAKP